MRTIFNEKTIFIGRQSRDFEIEIYDGCKYERGIKEKTRVKYKNLKSAEILSYEELENYEGEKDELNEYLKLTLENGETVVYRNSYVSMFHI